MWLSLLLLAIILAVAYLQAIQGSFSALIMCVLTIICCALAFGSCGYVADTLLMKWKPDFALPLSLFLCFVVPLGLARLAADNLIRRSCLVPALFDKVGGGVCGLVTGLILGGVLALCLQMLPFGGGFLGHQRVDMENPEESQRGVWLSPDKFAVRFASLLSNGMFSGGTAWVDDHPDFVEEVGWSQPVPGGVRRYAAPESIQLKSFEQVDDDDVWDKKPKENNRQEFEYEPVSPKAQRQFLAVRFAPTADAGDTGDKQHRFSPFQVRLVGMLGDNPVHYHAMAVQDDLDADRFIKSREADRKERSVLAGLYSPNKEGEIAVVFKVAERFVPRFLEYKMGARVALTEPAGDGERRPKRKPTKTVTGPPPPKTKPKTVDGRTHGADALDAEFSDALPHPMVNYTNVDGNVETQGDQLLNGHVMGKMDEQTGSGGLTRFRVPEGKALLQVDARARQAKSILGSAKSFAVRNLRNYLITDDAGGQYKICGQIAVANVGNDRVYEIQYYPEPMGSIGGVKKFKRIRERGLKEGSDYELYFLFVIDSGRKVVSFSTTGGRGGQDISGLDLVAP